jgi:hypothetical protein
MKRKHVTCLTYKLYDKIKKRPSKSHETIPLSISEKSHETIPLSIAVLILLRTGK